MEYNIYFLGLAIVLIAILLLLYITTYRKFKLFKIRFKDITDKDVELEYLNKEYSKIFNDFSLLKDDYYKKKIIYDRLSADLRIYEDELNAIDNGITPPIFEFDDAESYKEEILAIRKMQKEMIQEKKAINASTTWTVGNSKVKGDQMVSRISDMAIRAFNGDCDSVISKARWNNYEKMKERIEKSRESIDKKIKWSGCNIREAYLSLKLDELEFVYLYAEKKQQEKEAQRAIAAQIREEERAQKEFEKAKHQAEKEELRYNEALEKARLELESSHGSKLDKLQLKIAELERNLEEAHINKERAISMAQQTKRGHVYVISNIGSFGENVYKIGMTRRLDPSERVKELSDASVPFIFDIHAMIFSENAPQLETELHKKFWKNRVNYVNDRREFFNVKLEAIEQVVSKLGATIEFIKIPEAREYRETLSIQASESLNQEREKVESFPNTI